MTRPTPEPARPRDPWDLVLSAAFLLAIGLPPLATALGLGGDAGSAEGRALAAPPSPKLLPGRAFEFLREFGNFYNDRFVFRQPLIAADSAWQYRVLGESISPKVLLGAQGWMFYVFNLYQASNLNTLDQYWGTVLLTDDELRGIRRVIEARRDDAARRGARFLCVIVPNKEWIHPEHLPGWVGPPGERTIYDQLAESLRRDSGIEVLDPRGPLRDAAADRPRYFARDSHWNWAGALVADGEIVRALARDDPRLRPFEPGAMRETTRSSVGDLARMLALDLREVSAYPVPRLGWRAVQADPPFALPTPPGHGHRWYLKATRVPGLDAPSILVYHDSYMETLQPYLSEHFAEATFLWDVGRPLDLPDSYWPDLVLFELAERSIPALIPPAPPH
jgi:hypothetical protein